MKKLAEALDLDLEELTELGLAVQLVGVAKGVPGLVAEQVVDIRLGVVPPAQLPVDILKELIAVIEAQSDDGRAGDAAVAV